MLAAYALSLIAFVAPTIAQDQVHLPPVGEAIASAGAGLTGVQVPGPSTFLVGDLEVAAHSTRPGPVAVIGTLRVAGTITGDAFAYGGDIIVLPGGHVTGNAVAIGGRVQFQGGDVDGETRAIAGSLTPVTPPTSAASTRDTVALTLGWAGVALIIGLGILVAGGRTLDEVGATISDQFGKSFLVGVGATLGVAPLLALLVIALTLTILGVLLIPFAIVAYVLAVMGVLALGFIAAVCVTGHAMAGGKRSLTERGAALRALVVGTTFFLGMWLIAAVATPWPTFATVMRVMAFALTWAATTVGLGATIISRAGTRTARQRGTSPLTASPPPREPTLAPSPLPEWTTPTPVSGVVAARRRPSAQQKTVP